MVAERRKSLFLYVFVFLQYTYNIGTLKAEGKQLWENVTLPIPPAGVVGFLPTKEVLKRNRDYADILCVALGEEIFVFTPAGLFFLDYSLKEVGSISHSFPESLLECAVYDEGGRNSPGSYIVYVVTNVLGNMEYRKHSFSSFSASLTQELKDFNIVYGVHQNGENKGVAPTDSLISIGTDPKAFHFFKDTQNKLKLVMSFMDGRNKINNVVIWDVENESLFEQFYLCHFLNDPSFCTNADKVLSIRSIANSDSSGAILGSEKLLFRMRNSMRVFDLTQDAILNSSSIGSDTLVQPLDVINAMGITVPSNRIGDVPTEPVRLRIRSPYRVTSLELSDSKVDAAVSEQNIGITLFEQGIKIWNLDVGEDPSLACCYIRNLVSGIVYTRPEDSEPGALTVSVDNRLQFWDLKEVELVGIIEGFSGHIIEINVFNDRFLVVSTEELALYQTDLPPSNSNVKAVVTGILVNFMVVVLFLMLSICLSINARKMKVKALRNRRASRRTSLLVKEKKKGIKWLILNIFGAIPALEIYDIRKLDDYEPVLLFGGKIYATKFIMVLFLFFVGFAFSPNIMSTLFGLPNFHDPSVECQNAAEKLSGIEESILRSQGFFNGEEQLLKMVNDLNELNVNLKASVLSAQSNTQVSPALITDPVETCTDPGNIATGNCNCTGLVFESFPVGAEKYCTCIQAPGVNNERSKALEELRRQIQCTRRTPIVTVTELVGPKGSWESAGEFIKQALPKNNGELPDPNDFLILRERTFGGEIVPCEVDVELLDALEAQDLIEAYQNTIDRLKVPEVSEAVFEQSQSLLERLMWQVNLASDLYIIYSVFALFITSPFIVYQSSFKTRLKRRYFSISQGLFIFVFVLFLWTYPYIEATINLENLLKYFHNIDVDTCYIDGKFLRGIKNTVQESCFKLEQLNSNFTLSSIDLQDFNASIDLYNQCNNAYQDEFPELYAKANQKASDAKGTVLVAELCNQKIIANLVDTNTIAPGVTDTNIVGVLLRLGVLAQLFAKFILVAFAKSAYQMADPLAVHNGKVETIGKDTPIPPASTIERFLRTYHFRGAVISLFFFTCLVFNLLYLSISKINALRDLSRYNELKKTPTTKFLIFIIVGLTIILPTVLILWYVFKRNSKEPMSPQRSQQVTRYNWMNNPTDTPSL